MNEHDGTQPPVDGITGVSAEPAGAQPVLAEIAAPPLSPGEPSMIDLPKQRTADTTLKETPAEAEVIMLPAKFAAFLAASTARFRERTSAMPISGRQVAAVALMMAIAGASAAGGAMFSTRGMDFAAERSAQAEQARVVRESVARIEADLTALRGNIERTAKLSTANASKTGERLDRIEKAQAEPAARLAKLTDSVEKLRATAPATAPAAHVAAAQPAAAAAAQAARDITGSIAAPSSSTVVKTDPAKPAIVEGWVLRDAQKGAALIEGRNGLLEVYVGDSIPGIGRVDAVRRQDGQWTVVTAKGLIVAR